jgi:hypothetical protein
MKKILALAFAASLAIGFVACGPSEEEKKADSIEVTNLAKDMDNFADSVAKAMEQMNNATDTTKKDSAK